MGSITLDPSKQVFLSQPCLKDQKTLDHILKVLDDYKVPKDKIIKGIDLNILNSGDYFVRYSNGMTQVFEVQLTRPYGFTTILLGNL